MQSRPVVLFALLLSLYLPAFARADDAVQVTRRFYDWYVAYKGDALKDAQIGNYVHSEMLKNLREHRRQVEANGGEPVGYDADFFLHAQDVPLNTKVGKSRWRDDSCKGCAEAVTVSLVWSDGASELLVILENDYEQGKVAELRIRRVLVLDDRPDAQAFSPRNASSRSSAAAARPLTSPKSTAAPPMSGAR